VHVAQLFAVIVQQAWIHAFNSPLRHRADVTLDEALTRQVE